MMARKYIKHGTNNAGYGSFGVVNFYKLSEGNNDTLYAGKVVKTDMWNEMEMTILRNCQHECIVSYVDYEHHRSEHLIITELLNSSLHDALNEEEKSLFQISQTVTGPRVLQLKFRPALTLMEITCIVCDCFAGLRYLHSQNIVHRDISAPNILLKVCGSSTERQISAKLGDFGLSKLIPTVSDNTALTNVFYSAPETRTTRPVYGNSVDVYSFGVVIIECLMRRLHPNLNKKFKDNKKKSFLETAGECFDQTEFLTTYNAHAYDLVASMVDPDPDRRPSILAAQEKWLSCYENLLSTDDFFEDIPMIFEQPVTAVDDLSLAIDMMMISVQADEVQPPNVAPVTDTIISAQEVQMQPATVIDDLMVCLKNYFPQKTEAQISRMIQDLETNY